MLVGRIPLLLRRGGCGFNKKSRSHRKPAADGVVAHKPWFKNAFRNMVCERPPRPLHHLRLRAIALALRAKVASRHFLDVASTPPHEEGYAPTLTCHQFVHTFIDRRYSSTPRLLGV